MTRSIATTPSRSQLFVLDQDEALDFYTNKLGFEVDTDVDLGFMRWLTVCLPGDRSRQVLLERPGPPSMDDATEEPSQKDYGIDFGIRDPFGNRLRIGKVVEG